MPRITKERLRHGILTHSLKKIPVEDWPVIPLSKKAPLCGPNIKIVFELIKRTLSITGSVAECGVYRGGTLIPTGIFIQQRRIKKILFRFGSFKGFNHTVHQDIQLGGGFHDKEKKVGGFHRTSYEYVKNKVKEFGLSTRVKLIKGYFNETFSQYRNHRFSFVHLDCDLYQSYQECLTFFYPRLSPGGIILFDEYNDPVKEFSYLSIV